MEDAVPHVPEPEEEAHVHRPQPEGGVQRRAVRHHQPGDPGVEGRPLLLPHEGPGQPHHRRPQVDHPRRRHRPHVDRVPQHGHVRNHVVYGDK